MFHGSSVPDEPEDALDAIQDLSKNCQAEGAQTEDLRKPLLFSALCKKLEGLGLIQPSQPPPHKPSLQLQQEATLSASHKSAVIKLSETFVNL